jgi:hypothetical protein
MKNQYVILTGSKNNAGDYLIKYRAKKLFSKLRPDRGIVDYDGWKPFTQDQLAEINQSKALILLGGPSLQNKMRKNIYPMTANLDDLTVPIVMLGVGYKGVQGTFEETRDYQLDTLSLELLRRVNDSSVTSAVRDYHTLNVLQHYGLDNFVMAGCPALYSLDHLYGAFSPAEKINKVCFSMGVSYRRSRSMDIQMRGIISQISEINSSKPEVLFHHSIDDSNPRQSEFIKWLEKNNIPYRDISGSENDLIGAYSDCDLHVGYRVHAHIYCCSISKPSVLLSEDGRGVALKDVIGGLSYKAYTRHSAGLLSKIAGRAGLCDVFTTSPGFVGGVVSDIQYEIENSYPRASLCRRAIDSHFSQMERVISQLP